MINEKWLDFLHAYITLIMGCFYPNLFNTYIRKYFIIPQKDKDKSLILCGGGGTMEGTTENTNFRYEIIFCFI